MANRTEASERATSPKEPAGRRPRRRSTSTPSVRRSQRGKRQRPGEKKRGLKDKRRVQKDKRRSQEDRKEGVTVKRTCSDGKRRWDKKHYCVFCRRPQVKIARHLLRKHADQQEVTTASSLPPGSKQRHLLLEQLRCRGNYLHNIEVIRQGNGEIIPWRQPSEDVDARNYLPCPLCLGFFLRADLWKHQASCRRKIAADSSADGIPESNEVLASNPSGDGDTSMDRNVLTDHGGADRPRKRTRVQAAASRLLPISSGASESCSQVLHRMNQDHVSHQVKSDWLICKYGNKLMENQDGSQRRYDYVSQKLRELGRFLLAAKSLDSSIQTLYDLLAPGRLNLAFAAARKASGYRCSRPPLAVKTTLKTVCEISIGESLQDGDWEAAAKTTDFYHLLGKEWDNLGLLNPDPDTGVKMKKQTGSRNEKESCYGREELRPEVLSQTSNQQVTSMGPPESRLQAPVTVPMVPRKVRRRPWSSAEKEAVWRQLGVHVLFQSVPGKEVCQRCLDLEPVLRGRHWKDIKNQIHNQIQSQKKQQFHAQLDLEENQDHQEQIQNQKKRQQYQSELDQQDKDQTIKQKKQQYDYQMDQQDQNKKKQQQYHMQLDPHDQDSIHNHKKQQYQTQLGHQDHLHIQKKQICHTRLDQLDHIQVQKKQLYQMEQQTTLDRNPSVMTGTLYGPNRPHLSPGQSLLERGATISPYPLPHRTLSPDMDPLLSRTEWTDECLSQHYSISRQLDSNLLQNAPSGPAPANPHTEHVNF